MIPSRAFQLCAAFLLLMTAFPPPSHARTLRVGPGRNYKSIREAARVAGDGDIILLDAGVYRADVTRWDRDNLVIWAPDGRAQIRAEGVSQDGKGIWVVEGRNFTAENIEFSGARVPDRNGAGVRIHAKGTVTLRNCYFHHNEMGVLGDADEIVIDRCVFDQNGFRDSRTEHIGHNIYVWGPSVTIRNSYTHRAMLGHNIKTRAKTNYILYNRIMDESDGAASYSIDVPDCGRTFIIGNVIEQGMRTENPHLVSYGAESGKNDLRDVYVINNTFVNDGPPDGAFLIIRQRADVRVMNNIFYGPGRPWIGDGVDASNNYIETSMDNAPGFADPSAYDFHLTAGTPREIVDSGISPGVTATGYDLTPKEEYVYDAGGRPRPVVGPLDLGAFEFERPSGAKSGASTTETLRQTQTVGRSAKVTKSKAKKKKAKTNPARTSEPAKRLPSAR